MADHTNALKTADDSKPDPSKSPVNLAAKVSFLEATVIRRSTVDLKKSSPISDERIIEIVKHSLLHGPSPFHVQSGRAVVLLHQEHEKLWDLAAEAAKKSTPPELFENRLAPNLKAFKNAYGTVSHQVVHGEAVVKSQANQEWQVLFFEDPEAANKMPPMLGNLIKAFPEWGEHSNGINQYVVWTAFCAEGLGANLQHYQKYLGETLAKTFGLPSTWEAKAQLVFGAPNGPPRGGVEKPFADIEPRVKVLGAK